MSLPKSSIDILAMCSLFRSEGSSNKDIFINYSHLAPYLNKLRFFTSSSLNFEPSSSFIGYFSNCTILRTNILFQSSSFIDLDRTLPNYFLSATRITYFIIALARYVLTHEPCPIKFIDSYKGDTVKMFSDIYTTIQKEENIVSFMSMNVSFYDAKPLQEYLEKTIFQKYSTFEEILEKFETVYGTKYNFFR